MGLEASAQADGTVTYTRLTGDVRMNDVDFGYTPGKSSCMMSPYMPNRDRR